MTDKKSELETKPIGQLLLNLAIPAVLAQLVNLLYNIVDRIYIGHMGAGSENALAGVGVTFPIILLISAFASLIGMGGAPRAAIMMGKKDNAAAEKILGNCITMLLMISVLLTLCFFPIKEWILLTFGADSNSLPYAIDYISIYLIGTIFVQFAIGLNTFITSQGFATIGMATVCIGAIINIVLDPIFIFVFKMGVQGAALATIISQAVSAIWVVAFLCGKKSYLKIKKENLKLSKNVVMPILALGVSPFIMQFTECLVQLIFNKGMLQYGDTKNVAVMSVLFSIMQLVWLPMQGIAQGAQPILSYNYGARNMKRVKDTFRLLFIAAMTYSISLILLIELFPQFFIRLFTPKEELIAIGVHGIRIFMFGMAIMGAQSACQQTFLALGQAKISMFLALLRKVILIIPLALILPKIGNLGINGLYLSEPISDIIAVITTTTMFMIASKKLFQESEVAVE